MTLTGGKNWYGLPVENPAAHLADYARCLLKEGLLWSLKRNLVNKAGRAVTNKRNADEAGVPGYFDKHVLRELAEGGNADRFLDAAATACAWRQTTETKGGLVGIGPQSVAQGMSFVYFWG
ncbi:hypothetical protein NA56DRAFT_241950 [Hyaloscypha hepaticicola]|uniref:Uncharacterized protein n=1 Tax=Hyaloscypha hepaticicola TaxID=2082293 RepID=A0A2J6PX73_9HELO|nr:hypothetical protein NA56DRAFT_241950 [Hyaloscypha hepaticicola]